MAIPTETVYGLGANAEDESAVRRMYAAKNRPADHPVIVHVSSLEKISVWADFVPDYAKALMRDFWPGPMTLILKRSDRAKDFITGNQSTVGIRIPNHPVTLSLLAEFERLGGNGIVAPSANRYGSVSPTTAQAVFQELSQHLQPTDIILDGGKCSVGVESTIIDCTQGQPVILRPGAIDAAMIAQSCGVQTKEDPANQTRVSGSHKQHYSPRARVVLDSEPLPGDGLIALGDIATPPGVIRLAKPESLEQFAIELYAALRHGDDLGLARICAALPEGEGLAIAIRDRLTRAAAKG